MTLPAVFAPLAEIVPPAEAMRELVMEMGAIASLDRIVFVESLESPVLKTLAWLYLDELGRAHEICQAMDDSTGAALHAIIHRREGDFSNALYWWRRAGDHPALSQQDPIGLTKAVWDGDRSNESVERQREEWAALAAWYAT